MVNKNDEKKESISKICGWFWKRGKVIFDSLGCCEIELFLDNSKDSYMIIKYRDYVTFTKCDKETKEISFK